MTRLHFVVSQIFVRTGNPPDGRIVPSAPQQPMRSPAILLLSLLSVAAAWPQQGRVRPEFVSVEDAPGLARVLIIGDSISIGYTLPLRAALEGTANVHRPPENCQSTIEGLAKLDDLARQRRLGPDPLQLGLHDLKYIDGEGKLVSPSVGRQKVPPDQYGGIWRSWLGG